MFAIIVGTHGLFAEELVRSCEMICGEQKNVRAVTLVPGEGPDEVVSRFFRKFISSASKYRHQMYGFSSSAGCSISILNRCSMSI